MHCLLLPGTLCDARLFTPMQVAWSEHGFAPPTSVGDLHLLTLGPLAWCQALLADAPPCFDVIGFSLGGLLALQLLALAPQRVRRLVLVASNPLPASVQHRTRVRAQMAQWHAQGPQSTAEQMLQLASPAASVEVLAQVQAMAAATPTAALAAQGELNATRGDGLPALAHWPGPLLLVSGADDPWCGADKQQLMRSVRPDAQWCELPQTGHYLPLEQPHVLARLTHAFLT
jgi:pimeloyl-ACP methyl ester carboxylesterase